jgi:hypothetical protein
VRLVLPDGDEWSARWGGPGWHWRISLFPRIHGYLPWSTILEIAPSMGRWTHSLVERCERLIAVDLAEKCVDACKKRFAATRAYRFI